MSLIDWSVDRINPVVLRESRQLVRSRFAVGILMLFLLVMVAAAALFVVTTGSYAHNSFSRGKELFSIFYYVLGYASVLFVPAHTALPFLWQKQSSGMDLMFVSTIPPRSIIAGKMCSAFWMAVLLFSVSMPFMVLTVLLRGIGLFEVFSFLAILMALTMLATMGFLLLVSLPTSRVFTALLSIGYFMMLLMFPGITASFHYLGITGEVVTVFAVVTALLLPIMAAIATAMISPSIANRALGVRVTITVCWLAAGIATAFAKQDFPEVWAGLFVIGAAFALPVCASEPSVSSRRVQRAIPKNRLLRILAFPWITGPLSGWVWCWSIGLATLAIAPRLTSHWDSDYNTGLFAFLLYGTSYSLLAAWVRRVTFVRRFCAEKYTWAVAVFLGLLGTILPILAHFAVNPTERPDLLWELGNPFAAFDHNSDDHIAFNVCVIVVLLLMNLRWLMRQVSTFRPPQITAAPAGEE